MCTGYLYTNTFERSKTKSTGRKSFQDNWEPLFTVKDIKAFSQIIRVQILRTRITKIKDASILHPFPPKKTTGKTGRFVGLLGFEPRQTESKSVVLPLHHNPVPFWECKNKGERP